MDFSTPVLGEFRKLQCPDKSEGGCGSSDSLQVFVREKLAAGKQSEALIAVCKCGWRIKFPIDYTRYHYFNEYNQQIVQFGKETIEL